MNQSCLRWGQVPLKAEGDHRINDKRFFGNKYSLSSSPMDRGVRTVYHCGRVTLNFLYHEASSRSIGYLMSLECKQSIADYSPPPSPSSILTGCPNGWLVAIYPLVVRHHKSSWEKTIFSKSFRCTLQERFHSCEQQPSKFISTKILP